MIQKILKTHLAKYPIETGRDLPAASDEGMYLK